MLGVFESLGVVRRPAPDRTCQSLLANRDATAAVEFGLVCLPFVALLGAIIQLAFMIWANQNFDFLFQQAARSLFTGQFQAANKSITDPATLLTAIRTTMCSNKASLFDCNSVKIDVTLGSSFTASTAPSPVDPATKDWSSGFGTHYACAGPGKIVVATAAVKFPVFFNLLNAGISVFSDGSTLLQSTAVFRTEPYSSASSSPC